MNYQETCVIRKNDIYFSRKYDIFLLGGKWKKMIHVLSRPIHILFYMVEDDLYQKIVRKYDFFCIYE